MEESDEGSEAIKDEAEKERQTEGVIAPQQPEKRKRRLIQEKMQDFIVSIKFHSWNGHEYRFQVKWNTGREDEVGQTRLSKGNPQERHMYMQYVRKNPGISSSLGGRMLHK